MAGWLVATLRRYVGRDACVDNPAHVYLTFHPQISSSDISSSDHVSRRGGAPGNGHARIGSGLPQLPCPGKWIPPRNGTIALTILEMVIILLSSRSEILPWLTF